MAFSVGTVEATIGANMKPFERAIGRVRKMGMGLTKMISAPLGAIGGLALKTSADFETLRQSMDALNGSAEEGARNFERLKEFSAGTPFQLQDLAQAQNMLQGFGMEADSAFQSLNMIGDIAAITGSDIQGIGVAFGQAAAEGKVMTRDIRQFINQGVPMVKMLAETMGVAQGEIFDLASQGEISFDILQQAFKEATSEGGQFADGMHKQSQTLAGVFSTLKDNVSIALAEIGTSLNEAFNITDLVGTVTKGIKALVANFANMSDEVKKKIFIVAGVLGAAGPIMLAISVMLPAIGAIGTAFAALVSPVGLAVAAVAGLAAGVLYVWDNWKAIKERISDIGWWRNTAVSMVQLFLRYNFTSLLIDGWNAVIQYVTSLEWFQRALVKMTRFIADYSPFGLFEDQLNDLATKMENTPLKIQVPEIPNPFRAMADGLEGLKVETREYKTEFGSFMDAIKSGVSSLSGFSLSGLFSMPEGGSQQQEMIQTATATQQATVAMQDYYGWVTNMGTALSNIQPEAKKTFSVSKQIGDKLGSAFSNAVVHSKSLLDNIKNIGKQLLSKGIMNFVASFATGGLGGMFEGGFLSGIGKLIGIDDGIITGNGDVIKMHPNDKMFAMKDKRTPTGGGGISASAMQHAFESALDRKLNQLGPNDIYALSQRGKFSY